MADTELEDIEEETQDVETEGAEDITVDQALEWKKNAETERKRREKAEAKLVELKKQGKQAPQDGFITREELAIERFIDKNPDMAEYKEDISKYVSKGLSLEQAKRLVESDDKTIENRNKANALNITQSDGAVKSSYSVDELEKMPQAQYNKVMLDISAGKASIR